MVLPRSSSPALTVVAGSGPAAGVPRPSESDDAIVAAVRRGDAAVAAEFYWRITPVVERTVRRLFGKADCDAEDVVQIALVQIIESLSSYRGECPLDAWVAAVSANVVYKHIRRRRLERRIFEDALDAPEAAAPSSSGGVHRMLVRDATRRISEHLAAMRPDRSWTFLLHDVCGYSLEEIAQMSGISVAAAQSRLVRGRHEVHERIAADPSLAEVLERGDM
jgi:RNA polymerase sigma-70 factor, ECF subfamily